MIAYFIVGAVIGALLGYTTCALLTIAKQSDRHAEQNPPKEETKLLTVGNSVKWNGDVYEIEKFEVDEHNQTVAYIGYERFTFWVPIEELEALEE
jgi:hypothetical protein